MRRHVAALKARTCPRSPDWSAAMSSKRIRYAQLRPEQVKAWIRIGLSAVGQMLVKHSDVHFPVIIYDVRNASSGQNVECKILPLATRNLGVAVDPAGAHTSRDIRNESPVWLNEVVAKPHVKSEAVILDSFENRLRNRADIELMIAAQPVIASNDSPASAFCQKQRANLIIRGRINRTKQVTGLECEFDSVRIKVAVHGFNSDFRRTAEEPEANA